jgi:polysaccharide biosynthesis transport protein
MEPQPFSDDLRRYLALAWQWAWLLALAALLAGSAAFLVSRQTTPIYQASTLILINEAPGNRPVDYSSIITSERLASTYTEMIVSRPVLEGVIDGLGLGRTSSQLKGQVSVQPLRDTQLIRVQVQDWDPHWAALIANSLVAEFAHQNMELQRERYAESKASLEAQLTQLDRQIQTAAAALDALPEEAGNGRQAERDRLETALIGYRQTYASLLQSYELVRLTEAQSTSKVTQVESAVAPSSPISPRVMQNTLLAGVVGLMLAVGVIFLVEALDDSLRDPSEITRQLGLPVLALITKHPAEDEDAPISAVEPRSPVSEAFRSLRTNLQYASVDKPLRTILVTSPGAEEGKTTIAANLAVVMGQSGKRTILLDADLRRPRIHRRLNLPNRQGLVDLFLQTSHGLNGHVQRTPQMNLAALTTGALPPNPSELLGSAKMGEILSQLLQEADLVVVDSPPVLAVTDAAVLAPKMDAVVLVVRPGETKLASARQAVEQLRRGGANLVGVVLNGVDLKKSRYYGYQYQAYFYSTRYYSNEEGKKVKEKVKEVEVG